MILRYYKLPYELVFYILSCTSLQNIEKIRNLYCIKMWKRRNCKERYYPNVKFLLYQNQCLFFHDSLYLISESSQHKVFRSRNTLFYDNGTMRIIVTVVNGHFSIEYSKNDNVYRYHEKRYFDNKHLIYSVEEANNKATKRLFDLNNKVIEKESILWIKNNILCEI